MTPDIFLMSIVDPTLRWLSTTGGSVALSDEARVLVLAIAGQESNWQHRRQVNGPARSYWQFEGAGGGVGELFQKTPSQLSVVCAALDIPFDIRTVFEAMAWNDQLACSMARFLLWQDPKKLPALGDVDGTWDYYRRNWRPGAPHYDTWPNRYSRSLALVKGLPT
jgi:hypothetical protein